MVKPVVEQCEYHLLARSKIEVDFRNLFEQRKLGMTIFSPLCRGILTGKYNDGIPQNSRVDKKDPVITKLYHKYMVSEKEETLQRLNKFKLLA